MIDSQEVVKIFKECLSNPTDSDDECIEVQGISKEKFNKARLEKNRGRIREILDELPEDFKESKGGGGSSLNACMDKDGEQWTGLQAITEGLFLLGIAIGAVQLPFPREMWKILPGGMPYYVIKDR